MEDAVIEPLDLVKAAVKAAWDTKAEDIAVIDITGRSSYADHIVLCSGQHPRHAAAIAQNVRSIIKEAFGKLPMGAEGLDTGNWALLDYGDFVVHVFERNQRAHYDLDGLWADAPRLPLAELGIDDALEVGSVLPQPFSTSPTG